MLIINYCKRIKLLLGLFMLFGLFISNAKATTYASTSSDWSFWNYSGFRHQIDNKFLFTGRTLAKISSNDSQRVNLFFGLTSTDNANFFYGNKENALLFGQVYVTADFKKEGVLSLGFKDGPLSKDNILDQQNMSHQVSFIPLFIHSDNQFVIFDGSYLQYSNAFQFNYSKNIIKNTTRLNITYIPNLNFNISNNKSFYRTLQRGLGLAEGSVNFYNEYKDIGYGFNLAGRIYAKNGGIPKGLEYFISPHLDYMGFGFTLNLIDGYIKDGGGDKFQYNLNEVELSYDIMRLKLEAKYGYNYIKGGDKYGNRSYNNASFTLGYSVNKAFVLKTAVLYSNFSGDKANVGMVMGFNIKV